MVVIRDPDNPFAGPGVNPTPPPPPPPVNEQPERAGDERSTMDVTASVMGLTEAGPGETITPEPSGQSYFDAHTPGEAAPPAPSSGRAFFDAASPSNANPYGADRFEPPPLGPDYTQTDEQFFA